MMAIPSFSKRDMSSVIVWFRQDLRLSDHPALHYAIKSGQKVICVFIWSEKEYGKWNPGPSGRFWLHRSLLDLEELLNRAGGKLILRKGASLTHLLEIAKSSKAKTVAWNNLYEPHFQSRDRKIAKALEHAGLEVQTFHGNLLFDPELPKDPKGHCYRVYSFFWKTCLKLPKPEPLSCVRKIDGFSKALKSGSIKGLGIAPPQSCERILEKKWIPGTSHAHLQLQKFVRKGVERYAPLRDRPAEEGTSLLSAPLHFGEISPKEIWKEVLNHHSPRSAETFLKELAWREFSYQTLISDPIFPIQSQKPAFLKFPWKKNTSLLKAWQEGRTGYPMVDAGMRQLKTIGWMHNRVRMIVASFLVKHLLQPWQEGAKWFWINLVDADLANNSMGWQWSAGSGPDAVPYFRIFNPVLQGEKFDAKGEYIRTYVPELSGLPDEYIQAPWEAPEDVLRKAGVELGKTYPKPICDHKEARKKSLAAFAKMRKSHG